MAIDEFREIQKVCSINCVAETIQSFNLKFFVFYSAENECNRLRILEINNFLDAQRNMFNQMLNGLAEEWDLID